MSRQIARVVIVTLLAAAGLAATGDAASAQLMRFNALKGKIVAISGNVIQWTDATNAEMYVQINEETKSKVTGKAESSFLTPGLYVRFGAEVSKRGKVVNEIDELTIFTPGNGFTTGVFEDGEVDPKAASSKYFIAGQIESVKGGLFTIDTGDDSFKVELSDDVKINIDVPDIAIARADDEITLTGNGEAKTQIVATEIEIQMAAPLAGTEKKAKRSSKLRRATRDKGGAKPPLEDVDIPEFN